MSLVSIILPVYNGEKYIVEAVNSILNQDFRDFELILIDDGSTDSTPEILNNFNDSRIRRFSFKKNQGLVAALNFGLEKAQFPFIARMDADDIATPERLGRQVSFLKNNPEHVLCGMAVQTFPEGKTKTPPISNSEILAALCFSNIFYHSTVMFRSTLVKDDGLKYDENYWKCEDYKFWVDSSQKGKLASLHEIGLKYRIHQDQITQNSDIDLIKRVSNIRFKHLSYLGVELTQDDWEVFNRFCSKGIILKNDFRILSKTIKKISDQLPHSPKNEFNLYYLQFLYSLLITQSSDFFASIEYLRQCIQIRRFRIIHFLKLLKRDMFIDLY